MDYIAAYHIPGCGGQMFWVTPDVYPHTLVESSQVMLLDESTPVPGDPIICGSCGRHLEFVPLVISKEVK